MFLPQYTRVPEIFDSEEVTDIKRQKFLEEQETIRKQFEVESDDVIKCFNEAMSEKQ